MIYPETTPSCKQVLSKDEIISWIQGARYTRSCTEIRPKLDFGISAKTSGKLEVIFGDWKLG
jgi:hypothetical protein